MASITDDFSTDPLGTRWVMLSDTEGGGSETWTGSAWTLNAYYARHTTELDTLINYGKVTLTAMGISHGNIVFRATNNAADGFYGVCLYWAGWWLASITYNDNNGWVKDIARAQQLPLTGGDSMGCTIEGTGVNTVIRVWKNPTANSPVNASNWDSANDPPDIAFMPERCNEWDVFCDTGKFIGLNNEAGDNNTYDNFYAGDADPSPAIGDGIAYCGTAGTIVCGTSGYIYTK